jgi:hypothetical protein
MTGSGRWSGPDLGTYHLEGVIWFLFDTITLAQDNCPHREGGKFQVALVPYPKDVISSVLSGI